jgi:hypothetical protein
MLPDASVPTGETAGEEPWVTPETVLWAFTIAPPTLPPGLPTMAITGSIKNKAKARTGTEAFEWSRSDWRCSVGPWWDFILSPLYSPFIN